MGWVRLWSDMPTDPKWRVIARRSGQRIGDVIAVFNMMMAHASATNGSVSRLADTVIATALDLTVEQVAAIRAAMVGKCLTEDGRISEWPRIKAPKEGRPSAEMWFSIRTEVFARDGYTCTYCGQKGGRLECDHVIPVSRGGSSELDNLTTACLPCNRAKRDKLLSEWRH